MTGFTRYMTFALMVLTAADALAQSTTLQRQGTVTSQQVEEAIEVLNEAKLARTDSARQSKVNTAKQVLANPTLTELYNAEVIVDGEKQFEGGADTFYGETSELCYKGSAAEAAKLIVNALELGFWAGDEEGVKTAYVDNQKLVVVIEDRPNELEDEIYVYTCK